MFTLIDNWLQSIGLTSQAAMPNAELSIQQYRLFVKKTAINAEQSELHAEIQLEHTLNAWIKGSDTAQHNNKARRNFLFLAFLSVCACLFGLVFISCLLFWAQLNKSVKGLHDVVWLNINFLRVLKKILKNYEKKKNNINRMLKENESGCCIKPIRKAGYNQAFHSSVAIFSV